MKNKPTGQGLRHVILFTCILLLFITFFPSASASPLGAPRRSASNVETVANWIMSLQYLDSGLPSYGAIKVHHTAAAVRNGVEYFRVCPYYTNLGVWALLQAPVAGKLGSAESWITWYLNHLDSDIHVPYEYFYRSDGSGETRCLKSSSPYLCNYNDATDSAASTFIDVLKAYYDAGGDIGFLTAPGNKTQFETITGAMLALQQADGLTWAKSDYRVKYLMDNSEVYRGLKSMAYLETEVFSDPTQAQVYEEAAGRVRSGIISKLYDPATQLYRTEIAENGVYETPNLLRWYPDTAAQAWPHLFGVIEASNSATQAVMAALYAVWDEAPRPDWTSCSDLPRIDEGNLWPSIGYAALLSGQTSKARAHKDCLVDLKFPHTAGEIGFGWPFRVDDAGWLLMTLTTLPPPQPGVYYFPLLVK
jgi:hypothetical protein